MTLKDDEAVTIREVARQVDEPVTRPELTEGAKFYHGDDDAA